MKRPNVVFVLSDQHNAKCLGHKGHPNARTPNLDKLASEGVRFDNAITQNPICTPSRMCFISGQYAHNHGYLGNVSHVDHAVGELVAFLDANGLGDDTIVVYSADHGDYATEHGIMEKAPGICHDAITRIPFIWRWGGNFQAGHVATELVETVDVSATLCALCGIAPLETSDGRDITSLLRGDAGEVRDIAVTEFAWSKSVRKGDWRFVYYPPDMFREEYPGGFGELYSLADDPWEMNNLYFAENQRERIEQMRADLLHWLITTTRPVSVHGADMKPGPQRIRRYHVAVNADRKLHPDHLRAMDFKNYL
jgi:arylsulfatase A-like enzyme